MFPASEVDNYFKKTWPKDDYPTQATASGVLSQHSRKRNISFRSKDCSSKLRLILEAMFSCAYKKQY